MACSASGISVSALASSPAKWIDPGLRNQTRPLYPIGSKGARIVDLHHHYSAGPTTTCVLYCVLFSLLSSTRPLPRLYRPQGIQPPSERSAGTTWLRCAVPQRPQPSARHHPSTHHPLLPSPLVLGGNCGEREEAEPPRARACSRKLSFLFPQGYPEHSPCAAVSC